MACRDGGIRIMVLGLSGNRMDLVLNACQDGGIRIMGLGLSGNRMDPDGLPGRRHPDHGARALRQCWAAILKNVSFKAIQIHNF